MHLYTTAIINLFMTMLSLLAPPVINLNAVFNLYADPELTLWVLCATFLQTYVEHICLPGVEPTA